MILGLVLGPLMEKNLRRALALSGGEWGVMFSSPLAVSLWVLAGPGVPEPDPNDNAARAQPDAAHHLFSMTDSAHAHETSPTQRHYRAKWSSLLKGISLAVTVLLLTLTAVVPFPGPLLMVALVIGTGAFAVYGYTIQDDEILIHRTGWSYRLDVSELVRARAEPHATLGSIRTFGNGGMYGFTGMFRNNILGSYRAWMTNSEDTVVLEFEDRTVVISPEDPVAFVEELHAALGLEPTESAPAAEADATE